MTDTKEFSEFNKNANHPLQSFEWGEFRKRLGTKVVRISNQNSSESISMTLHNIPRSPFTVGYIPKCNFLSKESLQELSKIGKENKTIFIQIEPNLRISERKKFETLIKKTSFLIRPSARPLFTKYTFILDLSKTEEELLKNMHSKTRYNIKVAQKHNVIIKEDNSDSAFKIYLDLTHQTTLRQNFFAHTPHYHKTLWESLSHKRQNSEKNTLTSHLFTATYNKKILASWILFVFKDTLYYPYGASSSEDRHVMASNLLMWEVIRFGKKLGLRYFDMWGALDQNPNPTDPWYGFHKFKQGYGPELVEFLGSYDLILNKPFYTLYVMGDKMRWTLLKRLKRS